MNCAPRSGGGGFGGQTHAGCEHNCSCQMCPFTVENTAVLVWPDEISWDFDTFLVAGSPFAQVPGFRATRALLGFICGQSCSPGRDGLE